MSKYIIRKCPAIYGVSLDGCKKDHYEDGTVLCQDCTDCVMKQIVEKCNEVNKKFYDSVHQRYLSPSKAKFARQILELLDIEECE